MFHYVVVLTNGLIAKIKSLTVVWSHVCDDHLSHDFCWKIIKFQTLPRGLIIKNWIHWWIYEMLYEFRFIHQIKYSGTFYHSFPISIRIFFSNEIFVSDLHNILIRIEVFVFIIGFWNDFRKVRRSFNLYR